MSALHLRILPQAVIFDWDNTLVENWRVLTDAMNAALSAFHLPLWGIPDMMQNSKHSMRDSFPTIFGPEWPKARDIFYAHFRQHHLSGLHEIKGALALLDLLHAHGVKLAICSNKNGDLLRKEVRHVGWTHHFSTIIGAQDTEKDKPDPTPARFILAANNIVSSPYVWFIGDTATDMICGTRAGCTTLGIGQDAKENIDFLPHLYANSLDDVLTALRELLSSDGSRYSG
jgi:phosphoglycolate phosphatase